MRTVSVKSAARILDVLETLALLREPIGLNELARRLSIPKSSASALIATLEGRGYVVVDEQGYRLAPMMRDGGWVGGGISRLLQQARPIMQRLTRDTGESSYLGVPTPGFDIQYAEKVISDSPLRYDADLNHARPAYCTSIGLAILAGLEDDALDDYMASHAFRAETPKTITDPRVIRRMIDKVRRDGYATIADSHVLGTSGVAAPVRVGGRVVAALAVIAPTARFNLQPAPITAATQAAAHEIAEAMAR